MLRFKIEEHKGGGGAKKEKQQTEEDNTLKAARDFQIDAKIVRTMKSMNKVDENELIADVTRQIRLWQPQPADIKNRIESLIDRE